jgi:Ala-tRNA(Pro) deacylase
MKKICFAIAEELVQLTGLVPGSVLPFDLFVDDSLLANEKTAFNAGSLTDSLILSES